jgi:hypothetical protein
MSDRTSKQRVRFTQDLFDDGQDHHPPGYVARKGEEGVVLRAYASGIIDVECSSPMRFLRVKPGEF